MKEKIRFYGVIECTPGGRNGAEIIWADFEPLTRNEDIRRNPNWLILKMINFYGSDSAKIYIQGKPYTELFAYTTKEAAWTAYKNKLRQERLDVQRELSRIEEREKRAEEGPLNKEAE